MTAVDRWIEAGEPCALATVVHAEGSAPRGIGATVAVGPNGAFTGGITGGCAEAAVLLAAAQVCDGPADGQARVVILGPDADDVAPACGSLLTVVIERVDPTLRDALRQACDLHDAGCGYELKRAWRRAGDGEMLVRTDIDVREQRESDDRDRIVWDAGGSAVRCLERIGPPPLLMIAGAGDITDALFSLSRGLGWRCAVIEPRPAWRARVASGVPPEIFVAAWPDIALEDRMPDSRTAVVAASHDGRIDIPALARALESDAFYVGLVGSRAVQSERRAELATLVETERLGRLRGPAGLDLGGGRSPEIALSVVAEIVASWYGREGNALSRTDGPIRSSRRSGSGS